MPSLTSAERRRLEQMMSDPPPVHGWWKKDEFPDLFEEDGSPHIQGLEACQVPDAIFFQPVADPSLAYASYSEASVMYNLGQIGESQMRYARALWEANELPYESEPRYQQQQVAQPQPVKPQPQQPAEQPLYRSLAEASALYLNDGLTANDYSVARALYDSGYLPAEAN